MKILPNILCLLFLSCSLFGQEIPIDFEEDGIGADWNWRTFENASNPPLEIIPNPDSSGINLSSTVLKFTALEQGQPFAGFESAHGTDIGQFTITPENAIIRIMVWKSVRSDVGIKLVRADNWSLGELKIPNTLVNEWEQLEFDFTEHMGNPYDQIVIFPDFDSRQEDNIIYIDNIYGPVAGTSTINNISTDELMLFPNPTSHSLTLDSDLTFKSYEIYTTAGELVDSNEWNTSQTINVSSLGEGIYILKAYSENQSFISRFIKY